MLTEIITIIKCRIEFNKAQMIPAEEMNRTSLGINKTNFHKTNAHLH